MKKGKVLNLRGINNFLEFVRLNNLILLLTLFLIIGFVFGVFTLNKYSFSQTYAQNFVTEFIADRTNSNILKITFVSFISSMFFMVASFVGGTSIIGMVLVPCFVAVKGYLYGIVSALLYSEYSLKGIAFHAVILMPSALIFIIAYLFSSRESVRFSLIMGKLTLPITVPANLSYDFKNYCGKNLLFCLLVLLSALTDAVISTNFLSRFVL